MKTAAQTAQPLAEKNSNTLEILCPEEVGEMVCDLTKVRQALLNRREAFARTFTQNLLAYGLGRRVEYYDQPTIRAIVRDAADNDYSMSSFVLGVVKSDAFRMQRAGAVAAVDH